MWKKMAQNYLTPLKIQKNLTENLNFAQTEACGWMRDKNIIHTSNILLLVFKKCFFRLTCHFIKLYTWNFLIKIVVFKQHETFVSLLTVVSTHHRYCNYSNVSGVIHATDKVCVKNNASLQQCRRRLYTSSYQDSASLSSKLIWPSWV